MEILAAVRNHNRLAASILVVLAALLVGGLVVDIHFLGLSDRLIDLYQGRWSHYVNQGEKLLAEGQYEEAATFLQDLDRRFPARHAKHSLDRDRERLLVALGRAYEETGRRRLARETYAQLVDFDPRNFMNHYELADCLVRQGRTDEALASLENVMQINPSHFPTVRLLIKAHFDAGSWSDVVQVWEAYLDALVFAEVRLSWANHQARGQIPVDGRFQRLEVNLTVPPNRGLISGDRVKLTSSGIPFELGQIQAWPRTLSAPPWSRPPADVSIAAGQGLPRNGSLYFPRSKDEGVQLDFEADGRGVDHWRIDIRLLKPSDTETWLVVAQSYENLMEWGGLDKARARSLVPDGDSP